VLFRSPSDITTYSYEVEAFESVLGASSRAADEGTASAPEASPDLGDVGGKLTSGQVFADARFGTSVATDGNWAIVGASTAFNFEGAAYIFKREADGTWVEEAVLRNGSAGDGQFGRSVDISAGRAVVGAPYNDIGFTNGGSAYFYSRSADGTWSQDHVVNGVADQQQYGFSVSIHNTTAVVGQSNPNLTRKVDVFLHSASVWSVLQILTPSDGGTSLSFGNSVSLDGDRLAVGAPRFLGGVTLPGVYIYERISSWLEADKIRPNDNSANDAPFGANVSLDGDVVAIGSAEVEKVYVAERDVIGNWGLSSGVAGVRLPTATIIRENGTAGDSFGLSVSVSNNRLVAGARLDGEKQYQGGAAYLFARDEIGNWVQARKFFAADADQQDYFGYSVAISGDRVFSGAILDDDQGAQSGSVYSFYAPMAPSNVMASDGTVANRVLVSWQDNATDEDGYIVYRDGVEIANLSANITFYNDTGAAPGQTYNFSVSAARGSAEYESLRVSDLGWQPSNGNITGRVNSQAGAGVAGVRVVLEPAPGRSLLLDGVGGHVTLADQGEFDFTTNDDFTIESWFRYSGSDRQPRIISHLDPANTEGPRTFDLGFQRATGSLFFTVTDGTNAARVITTSESLNDDVWHQVSAVFDATDDSIRVYVDGIFEGSASTANLNDITNSNDVTIGGFAADSWFGGQLDEMRIWGVARTKAEIAASWNQLLTGDEAGLLGYWPKIGRASCRERV